MVQPRGRVAYNVADGEEWALLFHARAHVAAVVALGGDALVALDLGAKGLLAADEEERHCGCVGWRLSVGVAGRRLTSSAAKTQKDSNRSLSGFREPQGWQSDESDAVSRN